MDPLAALIRERERVMLMNRICEDIAMSTSTRPLDMAIAEIEKLRAQIAALEALLISTNPIQENK